MGVRALVNKSGGLESVAMWIARLRYFAAVRLFGPAMGARLGGARLLHPPAYRRQTGDPTTINNSPLGRGGLNRLLLRADAV